MKKYYKTVEKIELEDLDIPDWKDHTMSATLNKYIESKLPVGDLRVYLSMVKRFEVHAIYPDIDTILNLDLDFQVIKIVAKNELKKDNSNSIRSIFYLAKRNSKLFLVCCVTPGRDLLCHYSSMLGYFLKEYPEVELSVFSYPDAEQAIDQWTELDDRFVHSNDIVILGYSTFFKRSFEGDSSFQQVSIEKNKFYTSTRFLSRSGLIINCLEANFGHWGNISSNLSRKICDLGAKEIIHVGKVGTLTHSSEIYKRIYIPSKFLIARKLETVFIADSISNSLESQREYLSSAHVSVATTMEETFSQREMLAHLNVETIDIESSQIAHGVASYNIQMNQQVRFGAIHFSTDYLRERHELDMNFRYDLSIKRTPIVRKRKDKMLRQIFKIIREYFDDSAEHKSFFQKPNILRFGRSNFLKAKLLPTLMLRRADRQVRKK